MARQREQVFQERLQLLELRLQDQLGRKPAALGQFVVRVANLWR